MKIIPDDRYIPIWAVILASYEDCDVFTCAAIWMGFPDYVLRVEFFTN